MGRKEPNNSIFEDVDSSEQTIRLVKDVEDENTKKTKEVDVLADFKRGSSKSEEPKTSKRENVVEVEDDDNIPFEPTRELKVQRVNSYNDSDEYKERVIVNHSDDQVGVKKIIIGEETTTLPIYKRPKKSSREMLRDITLYIMMVA
ncbi:MAG: hypothetical protein K2L98_02630, partial [Bacilli bacterium]|nr:hypothetical protein [Bacilli bacterium]